MDLTTHMQYLPYSYPQITVLVAVYFFNGPYKAIIVFKRPSVRYPTDNSLLTVPIIVFNKELTVS